ncbi:MAG: 23S rRNA (guanosine(2251)-2'-O)-methyltransferase RlmB [Chloroflexi bacterium]|nr:23S rRNA (guanosine(2251)-2'-O)-methyltransferase RlmB [Chloroflexota bacterium]
MSETVVGKQPVRELLRAGRRVRRILVASGARESPNLREITELAARRRVPVQYVERALLDRLADHHQGIAAETDPYPYAEFGTLLAAAPAAGPPPLYLALDLVQDPQNFGTLLRTAAAVGVSGVLLPEHRAVGVTPAVRRASAGAVEHLRIARVTNLARALGQLKEAGVWVVGLEAEAPQAYDALDPSGPLAIVVGSEEQGLRRLVREACDFLVALPMEPVIDSLNAAVAGSIVLYSYYRQRQRAAGAESATR